VFGKRTRRKRNHNRVVAGQDDVDPDDGHQPGPESRSLYFCDEIHSKISL
jgi:hypothetical protein